MTVDALSTPSGVHVVEPWTHAFSVLTPSDYVSWGDMNTERGILRLKREAERLAWQLDGSDITGTGADESGLVRVWLDGAGQIERVEVGRDWWRIVGPDRLSAAILDALNRAISDRLVTWSAQAAERQRDEPPVDWHPPSGQAPIVSTPGRWDSGQVLAGDDRADQVSQVLDLLKSAMCELDDYRQRVDEQARQQVGGRSAGDHVTVVMAGAEVTELEISRRWLHEQPTGQAVAGEVLDAYRDACERAAQQGAAMLASVPAVAQVRALTADPLSLLHRLGLSHRPGHT